jgi:predicted AAA+ superfamily ATPase
MSHTTVRRYIDLLEQTFIVRTLPPLEANTKKRLIKSPKLFIRDTGLLHCLLGIDSIESLFAHPVFGSSWEGLVLEQVAAATKGTLSHYRTATGDELDGVIDVKHKRIAIECKASSAPKPTKGFYRACTDVNAAEAFIVAPTISATYPVAENTTVIGLRDLIQHLGA